MLGEESPTRTPPSYMYEKERELFLGRERKKEREALNFLAPRYTTIPPSSQKESLASIFLLFSSPPPKARIHTHLSKQRIHFASSGNSLLGDQEFVALEI